MKKFLKIMLAAILCGVFCVGVCACSCDDSNDNQPGTSATFGDDIQDDIFD